MKPAYNVEYNRKLVKILNETVPDMGQSVGILPERTSQKYVLSGKAPQSMQMEKDGGMFVFTPEQREKYKNSHMIPRKGGELSRKKVASKLLDIAPIALAASTAPLGNPFLTAAIGTAAYGARKAIKRKTGYGMKEKAISVGKKVAKTALPLALNVLPAAATLAGTVASGGNPLVGLAAGGATQYGRNMIKEYTGYGINMDKVKHHAKKIGKATISTALDVSPAVLGTAAALGTLNPMAGVGTTIAAKLAREGIRQATGYGLKRKKGNGIKNVVKKGTIAVLDTIPSAAGILAGVATNSDLVSAGTYGATKLAREAIRHKTGWGIKQHKVNKVIGNIDNNHHISKKVITHLNKHYKKGNIVGGFIDFDFEKFKKDVGPVIQSYISSGLDIAIPSICETIASYYVGNKEVGKRIGEFIRHLIKERTGYGLNKKGCKKGSGGLVVINGEIQRPQYKPINKRPHKEGSGAKKLNDKLKRRNAKVKEVMHEMGLSWIDASRYVSANKINY